MYFLEEDKTPWQEVEAGVYRKVFGYNDQMMMAKVRFKKGAKGAMHAHPHVQSSYVAEGKFEFTIGGEKKILKAGDGYFVPGGIEHGCTCLEDGLLIDVFHPMREDFL